MVTKVPNDVTAFAKLIDSFLDHFWSTHPVDASFAGRGGFDHVFAPATPDAIVHERNQLVDFERQLASLAVPDDAGARIDAALLRGYLVSVLRQPTSHARYRNPSWYTGETAFGIVALLLPGEVMRGPEALGARLDAIPDFLAVGRANLAGAAVPADWVRRARTECAAVIRLLERGLARHPRGASVAPNLLARAIDAVRRFDGAIATLPDADPATGAAYLELLARDVHVLPSTVDQLERDAVAEYARLADALETLAAGLVPKRTWREWVETLMVPDVTGDAVIPTLRAWDARAVTDAASLVTPAGAYDLTYAPMPDWALDVYADLYFLFYRSPAAYAPGTGSWYWATAPQSTAAIKLIHAVHHGSIGHHTQNARARTAASKLARIAGADGASGIALLGGGTLGEGWACYAEDLLAEIPGFYSPEELLLLTAFELRNVATCLGDLRLHRGTWNLDEMRRFYADEAAFAPARVWSETTRNSMFAGSRIMYWTGTRQIRELRARSPLDPKRFHDRLLSFGAAPVSVIGEEMRATASLP